MHYRQRQHQNRCWEELCVQYSGGIRVLALRLCRHAKNANRRVGDVRRWDGSTRDEIRKLIPHSLFSLTKACLLHLSLDITSHSSYQHDRHLPSHQAARHTSSASRRFDSSKLIIVELTDDVRDEAGRLTSGSTLNSFRTIAYSAHLL